MQAARVQPTPATETNVTAAFIKQNEEKDLLRLLHGRQRG